MMRLQLIILVISPKQMSISQRTFQRHRVRLLRQEAIGANLLTHKARWLWIKKRVLACNGNERSLEDLRQFIRLIPWPFKPEAVDVIVKDSTRFAKAFDAAAHSVAKNTLLIRKAKRRWPIKGYCERILSLQFSEDNKCKCPLHVGHSGNLQFVIENERWCCFGNSPPDPGRENRSGDVVDLHRIVKGFATNEEAAKDLLAMPLDKPLSSATRTPCLQPSPRKTMVDDRLVARALRESTFEKDKVSRETIKHSKAKDFAKLLVERILESDDSPIVGYREKSPVMGDNAKWALAKCPDKLQYLWCCTAVSAIKAKDWRSSPNGLHSVKLTKEKYDKL
jgi:hypothetical protein